MQRWPWMDSSLSTSQYWKCWWLTFKCCDLLTIGLFFWYSQVTSEAQQNKWEEEGAREVQTEDKWRHQRCVCWTLTPHSSQFGLVWVGIAWTQSASGWMLVLGETGYLVHTVTEGHFVLQLHQSRPLSHRCAHTGFQLAIVRKETDKSKILDWFKLLPHLLEDLKMYFKI